MNKEYKDKIAHYCSCFLARTLNESLCINLEQYFDKLHFKYHYRVYLSLRLIFLKSWFIRKTIEKNKFIIYKTCEENND